MTYRIYGCEDARSEQYEDALDRYEKTAVRSNVWQSALPPLYLAASEAGVLFILWFGAKCAGHRVEPLGHCRIHHLPVLLYQAGGQILQGGKTVQRRTEGRSLLEAHQAADEAAGAAGALQVPQAADVTLKDLAFAYGDVPIFSGLNLTAHPGDIIGITGPVACGKSTLGRVFLCEAPYAGSVRFGKTELSALTRGRCRPPSGIWAMTRNSAPTPCAATCSAAGSRTRCRTSRP